MPDLRRTSDFRPLVALLAAATFAAATGTVAAATRVATGGVQAISQARPEAMPRAVATGTATQPVAAAAAMTVPAVAAAAAPAATAASAAPAAPATELIDAAGLRKLLAAQQGRVVVLNLWATWCVPCLREIPDLVALEREFASRGVVLLGLSMDEPSALAGQVEPFRRKNFPAFRTWLRSTDDMDSLVSVVDPAWNEILPTTYLLGRDGKLAKKIQGKRTLEQFRELVEEVK